MSDLGIETFLAMEKLIDLSGSSPDKKVELKPESTLILEVPAEGEANWRATGTIATYRSKNVQAREIVVGKGLARLFDAFVAKAPEKVNCPDTFVPQY